MHYPDHPTADLTNPLKPQYTDGDEQLAVPATVVTPEALNDITNNLMAAVVAAGIVPTKLREADLADAIVRLAAGRDASRSKLTKSVAGGQAEIVLTDVEAGASILMLTGVRTDELLLTIPASYTGLRLVWNGTLDGFGISVRAATQASGDAVELPVNQWSLIGLDGAKAAVLFSSAGTGGAIGGGGGGGGGGAAIEQGLHSIWLPASSFLPPPTTPAAIGVLQMPVQGHPLGRYGFSASVAAAATTMVGMPRSWNGGVLYVEVVWSHPAPGGADVDVVWSMAARSIAPGETMDAALGAEAEVTAAGGAADVMYTSTAVEVTAAGTPAGGEQLLLRVSRDYGDVADTLPVQAYLLGVRIRYTVNAATDA